MTGWIFFAAMAGSLAGSQLAWLIRSLTNQWFRRRESAKNLRAFGQAMGVVWMPTDNLESYRERLQRKLSRPHTRHRPIGVN